MLKILEVLIETEELPQALSESVQKSKTQRGASPPHRWWAVQPAILARLATYFAVTERQHPDEDLLSELVQPTLSPHAESEVRTQIRDAQWRWLWRQQENAGLSALSTDVPSSPDDPRILDPFAGSGTIPAEATRLGCQAYALDLNPLSYQILRAALEFPVVFGNPSNEVAGSSKHGHWNGLADEVVYWSHRVQALVQNRLASLYPPAIAHASRQPSAYLWLHTAICSECGTTYPVRSRIVVQRIQGKTYVLAIDGDARHYEARLEKIEHPEEEDRRNAPCPACSRANSSSGFHTPILVAVVFAKGTSLKLMPVSTTEAKIVAPWGDSHAARLASLLAGNLCPDLNRDLPHSVYQSPIRHGAKTYGALFSKRQLLSALEFLAAIKEVKTEMQMASMAEPHISAITTYLSFLIGHIVERNSLACSWHHTPPYRVGNTFDRAAFAMPPLFAEQPPSQLIESWCDGIQQKIRHAQTLRRPSQIAFGSATRLPYSDESFDAIITDPPFFDRIPYAELSEFYSVWERGLWSSAAPDNAEAVVSASAGVLPEFQTHFREAVLEMFRVLKQGRGFTMLLTSRIKEHFEAYIATAQECGFELITVKSITEQRQFDTSQATVTAIACFRKPFRNARRTILTVNAAVTLKSAEQNKPVLYAALADLLLTELDERDLAEFIPQTAKGTKTEILMEVLADLDPRQLLRETLGRSGIRRISERLGVGREGEPAEILVDEVLRYYGFTIPVLTDESNPTVALNKLNKLQNHILQAREKADLRGSVLEVATLVERLLNLAVFGWARVLFGDDWREVLTGMLPQGHRGLDKLTFGDLVGLFRSVPDRGADFVAKRGLLGKVGTPHVYRPKRYVERLDKIVTLRNKVEHDRDGYWSTGSFATLAADLQSIVDQAVRVVGDLLAERVVPRLVRAKRESRDEWNRTTYTLLLDDGCEKEVSLSHPLKLGENYLYFGSATNPRPVDPIVIPLHER